MALWRHGVGAAPQRNPGDQPPRRKANNSGDNSGANTSAGANADPDDS